MAGTRALVLAGGGVAGIAWELGLVTGLRGQGVDVTAPDLIVGTSAGSTVGAQLASGVPLGELGAAQLSAETQELTVDFDIEEFRDQLDAELAVLDETGGTRVIAADDASLAAIGPNALDPSRRPAAYRAGLAQGERVAADIAGFWG